MPRQTPEVIAGMREPRSNRFKEMQEFDQRDPELVQVQPAIGNKSETLYLSKFPQYRVTITAPGDVINPVTGQRTVQRGITAEFNNGQYRNTVKDKTTRKLIDETLQRNSRFGKPGANPDYWLATDQVAAIQETKLANARKTLSELPEEVKAEFLASLKQGDAEDHALPAA